MTIGIQKLIGEQIYKTQIFPSNWSASTTGIQLYNSHTFYGYANNQAVSNPVGPFVPATQGDIFSAGGVPGGPGTSGSASITGKISLPWVISFYVRCGTNRSGNFFNCNSHELSGSTPPKSSFGIAAGADGISIAIDTTPGKINCNADFDLNEYSNGWHHVYILLDPRYANSTSNKLFVDGRRVEYTTITGFSQANRLDELSRINWGGNSVVAETTSNQPSYGLGGSNTIEIAQFGIWGSTGLYADGYANVKPIPLNKFYPNIDLGTTGKVSGVAFEGPKTDSVNQTSWSTGGYPAFYSQNPGLTDMRGYVFKTNYTIGGGGGSVDNSILGYTQWLSSQSLNPDSTQKTTDQYGDEVFLGIDADTNTQGSDPQTGGYYFIWDIKGLGSYSGSLAPSPPAAILQKPSVWTNEVPNGIYTNGFVKGNTGHSPATNERNSTFTYISGAGDQTITAGKIISFWVTYETNQQFKIKFPRQGQVYCPSPDDNYYNYHDYFEINLNYSATTASSNLNLVGKYHEPVVCPQNGIYPATVLTSIDLSWSSIKTYLNTTNKWNHFLLLCTSTDNQNVSFTLYINGQSLGSQTGGSNGYEPVLYDAIQIDQGTQNGTYWQSGTSVVKKGSFQQFWYGSKPSTFNIQDFYNNGYVDLGINGTSGATQTLPSPNIHEVFTYPFTSLFMPSPAGFTVLNKASGVVLTTYKGQED